MRRGDSQRERRRLDPERIPGVDVERLQTKLRVDAEGLHHGIPRERHEGGSIPLGPRFGDHRVRELDLQSLDRPPAAGGETERARCRRVDEP